VPFVSPPHVLIPCGVAERDVMERQTEGRFSWES
jgi:hypothetical protein